MKGIIRIAGLDFNGFSYVYWSLFVVREMVKRSKRLVGSTGVKSFHILFKVEKDRYRVYRVDYLLISCSLSVWQKLKREIEGRYVCADPTFRLHKRKHGLVRTEVEMWTEGELKGELNDFPVLIDTLQGKNNSAEFKIRYNSDLDVFYKPFSEFDACIWEENHEKNLWAGTLILEAERKWKRDGGVRVWRKRKAWKVKNGNYEEVK